MSAITDRGYDLAALGWDAQLAEAFTPHAAAGCVPGRIARADRGQSFVALTEHGVVHASSAARLVADATDATALPAVGDWVALDAAGELTFVVDVLPRRSAFVRGAAGAASVPQVLAANIDVAFVVVALSS
ncbi:MAG: hypothetical protein LC640_01860, partial [Frankia sp.]|nr:hypothetical protein [Frankia sp.]